MGTCSGSEGSEDIRREIARCARNKNLRSFEFTSSEPVVWRPHEVINPESGLPFTDISAWHFIADQVEKGCPLQSISMHKPPGSTGHVIIVPGLQGNPPIYIKVTLRAGKIRGRSFHNSTQEIRDEN